jgi:hypothetical protein
MRIAMVMEGAQRKVPVTVIKAILEARVKIFAQASVVDKASAQPEGACA